MGDDLLSKATALREACERAAEQLRQQALPVEGPRGANEPAITFRIRTGGVQEPSDSWMADEWAHWKRAGRSLAEFRDAFAPEPDEEPEPTILRRLRTGEQ
jgi:hypothetical protein